MPIKNKCSTKNGERMCYYQWGDQKKYWYHPDNEQERKEAKRKAEQQRAAIYASGYKGD